MKTKPRSKLAPNDETTKSTSPKRRNYEVHKPQTTKQRCPQAPNDETNRRLTHTTQNYLWSPWRRRDVMSHPARMSNAVRQCSSQDPRNKQNFTSCYVLMNSLTGMNYPRKVCTLEFLILHARLQNGFLRNS